MASNTRRRQRAVQDPQSNLQQNNGELRPDPSFVRTWEEQPSAPQQPRRPQPFNQITQPEQSPQELRPDPDFVRTWDIPEQSAQMQGYNMAPVQAQQPQTPSLGSQTYQSFEEYSKPFKKQLRASSAAYDTSPYQQAFDAQVQSLNQLKTNNVAQADRERALNVADVNALAVDQTKQLEKSYDPKLASLKQFLSDRGILDGSEAGKQLTELLTTSQDSVRRVQDEQAKRVQQVNETYAARTAQIEQQIQGQIADQQSLLAQRLDALAKDRRIADENKQQFQYQIYKDYQNELQKIDDQQRQNRLDEYNMAQDALKNDLDIASVTGMYQGQPTFKSQQEAAEAAYKQEQDALKNQLAQEKFDLTLAKKGISRSSGGSSPSVKSATPVGNDLFRLLTSQNVEPKVALEEAVKSVPSGSYGANRAALRNQILSGPAGYAAQPQEGPLRPGENRPNALTVNQSLSWDSAINPKKKSSDGLGDIIKQALLKRANT